MVIPLSIASRPSGFHIPGPTLHHACHHHILIYSPDTTLGPPILILVRVVTHALVKYQPYLVDMIKDENGTEISRTEPHRFLYLIRSNSYFLVRLYRFRFRIWDVSYFKCKSRKRFTHFSTVFYFSTFNLKYSEFKIRFKPNLANCTGHTARLLVATSNFNSYYPASY